jgi:hypothetical protein
VLAQKCLHDKTRDTSGSKEPHPYICAVVSSTCTDKFRPIDGVSFIIPGFRFGTVLPVYRLLCLAGASIFMVSDQPAARKATIAAKEHETASTTVQKVSSLRTVAVKAQGTWW